MAPQNETKTGLIDAFLKVSWEELTELPFQLFLDYANADTPEKKQAAILAVKSAQAEIIYRNHKQHLIENFPDITEEEIQKCLECL